MDLDPSHLPKTSLPKALLHQGVPEASQMAAPRTDGIVLNGFLNPLTWLIFISKMYVHFGILHAIPVFVFM